MRHDGTFSSLLDEDVAQAVALWQACGLVRRWNDPYADIAFARGKPNSDVLVRKEDSAVVASVMVGHDGHRGTLYYVAVSPEAQGRGLGRAAVRAAEEWLSARGVWKANLLVRAENERVRGFYEALGYGINPVICMARCIK